MESVVVSLYQRGDCKLLRILPTRDYSRLLETTPGHLGDHASEVEKSHENRKVIFLLCARLHAPYIMCSFEVLTFLVWEENQLLTKASRTCSSFIINLPACRTQTLVEKRFRDVSQHNSREWVAKWHFWARRRRYAAAAAAACTEVIWRTWISYRER